MQKWRNCCIRKKCYGDNVQESHGLKEGDNNTSYFHRKASWRAKKNRILSLKDNNGKLVTDEVQIGKLTNGFFTNLLTKEDLVMLELIINQLQMRVNEDMNSKLCKEFSNEEISDALFQIGPPWARWLPI